ncbi:DivIVA domain-containing protein [Agrococcus sp. Marseille-P2731]|uniref:DivIVA domain-containing protein n=1 Tax=Agrococcus sp. Marseille-P2731 TaxID=1841862 RepID=UPI000931A241|nr:DivIVA domain-containing protein [Agrococcus sp. Marseille-P2731]
MLTPQEIVTKHFSMTRFAPGYEADEVDDYLDRIVLTLRGYLEGDGAAIELLSDDVAAARFATTRFREGYAAGEVDAFLDEVRATLRSHEQSAGLAPS